MVCVNPKCKAGQQGADTLHIRILFGFKIHYCRSCGYYKINKNVHLS